jgi:ABC-type transporter Mla MlaB component
MRSLRLDAVVTSPRDVGHLALYVTMLSGSLARQPIHLYVDLTRCPSVDPGGVELLVELHRRLAVCGGQLTLRRPSAQVRHLLQLSSATASLEMSDEGPAVDGLACDSPDGDRRTIVTFSRNGRHGLR